ncbi:MAG: hypothetical protein E7012_03765 [Alphaproteobacteria bacterium]|nr:hypothetical protein [Alphaproteobacteria bacterium]
MNKYTITSVMILLSSTSLAQDSCMVRPSCADMGYTKSATDCDGKKAIRCPFDTTLFYCPESGFSEYPLEACPDNGVCSELTQYKLDSCQNSYELSSDGLTCNACNFTNYPLSNCDANGTCSDYTCGNVTKYKLDSCKSGYTQSGNTCAQDNPCAGYYECGGDWQYCEGYTCSADSSMCSEYCVDDYFSYECDSEYDCNEVGGVYRNGYCSEECECTPKGCSNYPLIEEPIEGVHGTVYVCEPGCGLPTRYKLVCDIHSELIGNECVECDFGEYTMGACSGECEEMTCGAITKYKCALGYTITGSSECRYCPDSYSYKAYHYEECPDEAESCVEQECGGMIFYNVEKCKEGYVKYYPETYTEKYFGCGSCEDRGYIYTSCAEMWGDDGVYQSGEPCCTTNDNCPGLYGKTNC